MDQKSKLLLRLPLEEYQCLLAWRDLTRDICPPDPGTNNGHTPDTCAGGAANPKGCFLVMDEGCNKSMGAQCGNAELPNCRIQNAGIRLCLSFGNSRWLPVTTEYSVPTMMKL